MRDEVRQLRDEVFKAMAGTNREDMHRSREAECVDRVAKAGNVDLLSIFLTNMDSDCSFRAMENAYGDITRCSDVAPALLINEHGMKMREMILVEMMGDFFQNLIPPISVMAMSMTEEDVLRVVNIIQRGIIGVEGIRAMLQETDNVETPLRDGAL